MIQPTPCHRAIATTGERVADYEVNLKAELEIMALHEKLDALRSGQLASMLDKQERQIELLTKLLVQENPGERA